MMLLWCVLPVGGHVRGRWLLQPLVREADILGRQAIVALLVDKRGLATSLAAVRAPMTPCC